MSRLSRRVIIPLSVVFLLLSEQTHAQIAVIVNSKNPVESLSLVELKRTYLGEIGRWNFSEDRHDNIILIDYNGEVEIVEKFYEITAGMAPVKIRLKWLDNILNGKFHRLPVRMDSEVNMIKYISDNVGAIGFVRAEKLDSSIETIKSIEVEGKRVVDKDYPIR